jgi:hypothetical protein
MLRSALLATTANEEPTNLLAIKTDSKYNDEALETGHYVFESVSHEPLVNDTPEADDSGYIVLRPQRKNEIRIRTHPLCHTDGTLHYVYINWEPQFLHIVAPDYLYGNTLEVNLRRWCFILTPPLGVDD